MGPSLSRTAEDLVRAGKGESVRWQGLTLRSHLQPVYSVRKAGCIGLEGLLRGVTPESQSARSRQSAAENPRYVWSSE